MIQEPSRLPLLRRQGPPLVSLLVALALRLPATAGAAPSIDALLQQYVTADTRVHARGTTLTVQPTATVVRTTTRRVVRRAGGRSLAVGLLPESNKGVILADDGAWTIRYDPREAIVRKKRCLDPPTRVFEERRLRLLKRNYKVTLDGTETVAGRTCRILTFRPKEGRDRITRVWLDVRNGFELRRDELDANGSTITMSLYTSVDYPSTISLAEVTPRFPRSARIESISRSGLHADFTSLSRSAGFEVKRPLTLPAGYEFIIGTVAGISGRNSAFLRYTDGLSDLTMIQTPYATRGDQPSRGVRVLPRPYGETEVDCILDGMQVVLVGGGDARDLVATVESLQGSVEDAWRRDVNAVFHDHAQNISAMRDRGLSSAVIVALLTLSAQSGRSTSAVLRSYLKERCWRDLARRWRVPEAMVERRIRSLAIRG